MSYKPGTLLQVPLKYNNIDFFPEAKNSDRIGRLQGGDPVFYVGPQEKWGGRKFCVISHFGLGWMLPLAFAIVDEEGDEWNELEDESVD